MLLPQATGFLVANEAGWNALIARLRPVAAIGLELRGAFERGIIRALLTASLSASARSAADNSQP